MTETVDFDKLQAATGPAVDFAHLLVAVRGTGTSAVITGFSSMDSLFVEARALPNDHSHGSSTLTLLVEQSSDGISWSTAATLSFTADSTQTATITSPEDRLRVSWSVAGTAQWNVPTMLIVPPAGGGGGAALDDPGNVWVPATVVAAGYRIKNTAADGRDHVFEATGDGTTADYVATFDELSPDYGPDAITHSDGVLWKHIGVVDGLPYSELPPPLPPQYTIGGVIGDVTVLFKTTAEEEDVVVALATADGVFLEIHSGGDGDWTFVDTNASLRWSGQNGGVNIGYTSFGVGGGGSTGLRIDYSTNPPTVFLKGLPTANPHVNNQLWNNGGVMTISAG